jgi:hypothetical protein
MAEADVDTMSRELRSAVKGTGDFGPTVRAPSSEADPSGAPLASEIEALGRARRRAEHEAAADAELEALKRQMGK